MKGKEELVIYLDDGEWIVCFKEDRIANRGPDDPNRVRPIVGTELTWVFDNSAPENVVAHFQFTNSDFVSGKLSRHWTATLPRNGSLALTLTGKPYRRVYYSVFITPPNEYAIGCNPPPKIDVGP